MVSGNGLNAVKHHHRPMMEDERHRRREPQLLEDQKSATLSFFSTKDRTIAAKMLVVEAHRYQRVLQQSTNLGSTCKLPPNTVSQETHPMCKQQYFQAVFNDITVLMARVPPNANRARGDEPETKSHIPHAHQSHPSPRPAQDYYTSVKKELAGIDMWRHPNGAADNFGRSHVQERKKAMMG